MNEYAYVITPFIGWLVAQGLKFFLSLRQDGVKLSDSWQSGGMPSSHTTFMVSLTTIVGVGQGVTSVLFAISASVTAIVLYDAIGVRRTTGELVSAVEELAQKQKVKTNIHKAKGHTPQEVAAGIVLGVIVGLISGQILL
jgi:acid phosphatase family membrane protein YuiD